MKYYIFWSDYDHDEMERFKTIGEAETRLTEILEKLKKEEPYGGRIKCLIYGEALRYEVIEYAKAVKIREEAK